MTTFGQRLLAAVHDRGPLCAGIDPHVGLLRAWGLPESVAGLERFALTAVEGMAPYAAAVKPQSAFFERFGSAGVAVLERVIREARAAGAQVILDVKRGDIGSTSQAYADAYLDRSAPLAADAVTASPYLGVGSLEPLFATARAHGAGVFVLALTSNPEGPQVQLARAADGRSVAQTVLDALRELNAGAATMGSFGAVVGATIGSVLIGSDVDLDVRGPLLAPGVGAQGGTVADVRRVFGAAASSVLPSSSRELLARGPDVAALRDGVRRTAEDFASLLHP